VIVILKLKSPWLVRPLSATEDLFKSRPRWSRIAAAVGAALAGLTFSATTTADIPADRIPFSKSDPRAARLEHFFKTYHCPTPYPTFEYLRAADGYGLDYRLLPAVSIRETSCGRAERQQHNAWGYHPGHQEFPSVASGISFVAQRLAEHPLYKGKTMKEKLLTYNPRPAYPGEIDHIMRQIEKLP